MASTPYRWQPSQSRAEPKLSSHARYQAASARSTRSAAASAKALANLFALSWVSSTATSPASIQGRPARHVISTKRTVVLNATSSSARVSRCGRMASAASPSTLGRRMRSAGDQRGHEVIVPGGGLALALEAGLQCRVGAREVEGDLTEQGQVPGGSALAHPTGIFIEPDVEHPVKAVLDRPMAADGGGKLCRWQLAAGEIVTDLGGDLA